MIRIIISIVLILIITVTLNSQDINPFAAVLGFILGETITTIYRRRMDNNGYTKTYKTDNKTQDTSDETTNKV